MGKLGGGGSGGATAAKKKKRGRPSLVDLQKRAIEQQKVQQNQQRRSGRRNPNSTSGDGEEEYYDDDDDERKEKKVKLVVRLPQSDQNQQQLNLSSDLIRSSSVNSVSCGSDSNADVDNRKVKSGSNHQGEKTPKAMDSQHGSPLESGPITPLPDKKLLVFILDRLQKKDTHGVFSDPVDPYELPDYYEIIKQPMDFGTLRSKLDAGLYPNLEELEADVNLICSNAMQYNSSDTIYFRQARSIQELAKRDFENLRQEGEDGELQPKVVKRGRPPGKQQKKTPGRPPLDRVGPESTSGATLATPEDNTTESTPYNLRKAPPVLYRFQADGLLGSHRSRNGEHYSELLADWNEEFPERIRKADMKWGNKNLIIDETRRETYKQFHPSIYANDSSLLSNFGGERKQLLAVGLHAEHGYARSLARFAANLGPTVWKVASKKIEKALPPGTKFAPGVVGEIEHSPPPSSFFPSGNPRHVPALVNESLSNQPQTPSSSFPNPDTLNHSKVEMMDPDIRTGSSSQHVRSGFNSIFTNTTAVEHERVGEVGGVSGKLTSWQQVSSSNPSPFMVAVSPNLNGIEDQA